MARFICRRNGIKPDGSLCDAFSRKTWTCTAESCEAQIEQLSDEDIKQFDSVDLPSRLDRIREELQVGNDPYPILPEATYAPIRQALAIIEQMSTIGKKLSSKERSASGVTTGADMSAYWDSAEWLERDMGILGALHSRISVLAARMASNAEEADEAKKTVWAQKYLTIKRNIEAGIRPSQSRPTDEELKNLVRVDEQVQDVIKLWLESRMSASVMKTFADSMVEHINIMKKRVDSLREERRLSK